MNLWLNLKELSMVNTTNMNWQGLLHFVMTNGHESSPRGQKTKELLGLKSLINMTQPVINIKERKLGYKFMAAEAAWIMSGDNRVSTIQPFSKAIGNFSDDGILFFGAYGPKVRDQLGHVLQSLIADSDSRQAVLTIWRSNPRASKDIPCTISCQFMIRGGYLHCFMNMRSSDAWLGVPYDWFNFSMLSAGVALLLRDKGLTVKLGQLHFYAASQHLYESNWAGAEECQDGEILGDYAPFDLDEFFGYDDLVQHLWSIANDLPLHRKFLSESKSWKG
jgi:thymidylate synthase